MVPYTLEGGVPALHIHNRSGSIVSLGKCTWLSHDHSHTGTRVIMADHRQHTTECSQACPTGHDSTRDRPHTSSGAMTTLRVLLVQLPHTSGDDDTHQMVLCYKKSLSLSLSLSLPIKWRTIDGLRENLDY